jgi:hypothetical protein
MILNSSNVTVPLPSLSILLIGIDYFFPEEQLSAELPMSNSLFFRKLEENDNTKKYMNEVRKKKT